MLLMFKLLLVQC